MKAKRFTQTPEQQKAREEKRAKFRAICKQVAAMSDLDRAKLTNKIGVVLNCEGRALSPFNTCLLLFQSGGAVSVVGGFRQWIKAGRSVRKGEHGYSILVPTGTGEKAESETKAEEQTEESVCHFVGGTVFDISQTEELNTQTAETMRFDPLQTTPPEPAPDLDNRLDDKDRGSSVQLDQGSSFRTH